MAEFKNTKQCRQVTFNYILFRSSQNSHLTLSIFQQALLLLMVVYNQKTSLALQSRFTHVITAELSTQ